MIRPYRAPPASATSLRPNRSRDAADPLVKQNFRAKGTQLTKSGCFEFGARASQGATARRNRPRNCDGKHRHKQKRG
jgi:hypothetical protein